VEGDVWSRRAGGRRRSGRWTAARLCTATTCGPGFVCNPEKSECVKPVTITGTVTPGQPCPSARSFTPCVSGLAATDAWAVGAGGTILHFQSP